MNENLFNEIGGSEIVSDIVDKFYDRVVDDSQLKKFFEHVPIERIKSMQTVFFSVALGAPLEYTGRSLSDIHRGMGITRDDLSVFTNHLLETLSDLGVSTNDSNRFVARIATYADELLGETTVDG